MLKKLMIGAAIAVPLVLVALYWGKSLASFAVTAGAVSWLWLLLVALVVGGGAVAYSSSEQEHYGRAFGGFIVAVVSLVVFFVAALMYGPVHATRFADRFVAGEMPAFGERASYPQAKSLLRRNVGDVQGTVTDPMFVGDGGWTVIVDGGGLGLGIEKVVEWDGKGEASSNFHSCPMRDKTPAINGTFGNSMRRAIRGVVPWGDTQWNFSDTYGYCDDEGYGVIVVPLIQQSAGWPTTLSYAGLVQVRSGSDVAFIGDVEPGTIPGPVYPLSLVGYVEDSNGGRFGSSGDVFFARNNVLRPDGDNDDAGDDNPNAGNVGQFVLNDTEGHLWAVTPMVRANSAGTQIVSVLATRVDSAHLGEVNTVTVDDLEQPRKSSSEVAAAIPGSFSELNWAAGLRVYEVTPMTPELWVGTIGKDERPVHRFTVDLEGRVCVTDIDDGKPRGCSFDDPNASGEPDRPVTVDETGTPASDLGTLSLDELMEMRDAAQRELDRRLRAS